METGMTKHQYLIRNLVNSKILLDFFPSYQCILSSKKDRYPDNISVDESYAEVELQSFLNNTASSVLKLQSNVIETITDDSVAHLLLIGKWGFDGSTGHSEYKQKFSNHVVDDKSFFVTSYVPLQLILKTDQKEIWKNPRPSFKKETTEVSKSEEKYLPTYIHTYRTMCPKEKNIR